MKHKLLVALTQNNFTEVVKEANKATIKDNKRVSYVTIINRILTTYFKKKGDK